MKYINNLLLIRYGYVVIIMYLLVLILPVKCDARESVKMIAGTLQHKLQQKEPQIQNPHWQPAGCSACHNGKPTRKNLKLHVADINALCNSCHTTISNHSYIHPFGMTPSKTIMKNMPASFSSAVKRGDGKLTCITCHDLTKSCLAENASQKGLNPLFFRDGPFKTRTEICYRCHEKNKYTRLNPHDQIDANGELKTKTCTVCHASTDKLTTAKNINDIEFNFESDLSSMCTGCHPVKPHPGGAFSFFSDKKGPDHLVKPPEDILSHKLKMEKINEIILPLEPGSGKIFCGTCHNPHQKGVIKDVAAAKGAGSNKRLRMQELCRNCHNK